MAGKNDLIIVKPLLTKLLQGQKNAGFIAGGIFPAVNVVSEQGKFPIMGDDEFDLYQVPRALKAESVKIDFGLSSDDFNLEELSAEAQIDTRMKKMNQLSMSLEQLCTEKCKVAVNLYRENTASTLIQNDTNYASTNKKVLDGTSGKYYWSDTTNGTPIDDINNALDVIKSVDTELPVVCYLGEITLWTLRDHPVIRRKINKYGTEADPVTNEAVIRFLKEEFGFAEVYVGRARVKNASGTKTRLWADNFGIVRRGSASGKIESAFGYELIQEGSTFAYGYKKETEKSDVVGYQSIQTFKVMDWTGAYLIKNTHETL